MKFNGKSKASASQLLGAYPRHYRLKYPVEAGGDTTWASVFYRLRDFHTTGGRPVIIDIDEGQATQTPITRTRYYCRSEEDNIYAIDLYAEGATTVKIWTYAMQGTEFLSCTYQERSTGVVTDAVRYSHAQALSDEDKARARNNIGAVSAASIPLHFTLKYPCTLDSPDIQAWKDALWAVRNNAIAGAAPVMIDLVENYFMGHDGHWNGSGYTPLNPMIERATKVYYGQPATGFEGLFFAVEDGYRTTSYMFYMDDTGTYHAPTSSTSGLPSNIVVAAYILEETNGAESDANKATLKLLGDRGPVIVKLTRYDETIAAIYYYGQIAFQEGQFYVVLDCEADTGVIYESSRVDMRTLGRITSLTVGDTDTIKNANRIALHQGAQLCEIDYGFGVATWTLSAGGFAHITTAYGVEEYYDIAADGAVTRNTEYTNLEDSTFRNYVAKGGTLSAEGFIEKIVKYVDNKDIESMLTQGSWASAFRGGGVAQMLIQNTNLMTGIAINATFQSTLKETLLNNDSFLAGLGTSSGLYTRLIHEVNFVSSLAVNMQSRLSGLGRDYSFLNTLMGELSSRDIATRLADNSYFISALKSALQ